MIGLMLIYLLSIKKAKSPNYATIGHILCKIMEQFMRDYIIQHFLHNDLFSKNQFGFLKADPLCYSYCILWRNHEWTAALENGGQINTSYTDFEKAFDKVPHHLLLKKIGELQS